MNPLGVGPAEPRRILVIDDDPDIVRIIRYMLRDAGYSVTYAYNGTDGIQKVRAEKPDLVLTDLAMPTVSGVDVIDALRNDPETRSIPILAVTAHALDTFGQVAHQLGCAGRVAKPFTSEQLLHHIRRHLDSVSGSGSEEAPQPAAAPEGQLRLRV